MTIFGGGTRGSSVILTGGDRVDCGGGSHPACRGDCSGSTSSSSSTSSEIIGDIKEIRSGIEMGSVKGSGCDCNFYQVTQNTNPLLQRTPTAPSTAPKLLQR